MKIILLNPPAYEKLIRDYYCSKTSKSTYLFAPVDLLFQSGILAENNELIVIDAVALGLSFKKCLEIIKSFKPDLILGLVGLVSLRADLNFYQAIKSHLSFCQIFLSGEPLLEAPEKWLERNPFIDGILLRFISSGLKDYLEGDGEPDSLAVKDGSRIKVFSALTPKIYSVGRTRQELFQYPRYFFSFARCRKFATFLTDFGCPHKCKFCVMSALGYSRRKLDEVENELDYLRWLGIKELFLADQSFGSHKEHAQKVMELFARYGFSYTAFVRPDHSKEFWCELKSSGCHTVIMGVESADENILKAYNKGYGIEEIKKGVREAKEAGLRVVATAIIGLPEDSRETIQRTMKFLKELEPDFVSYNLAVARSLTDLRKNMLNQKLIINEQMDQAGASAQLKTRYLTSEELVKLKKQAVRDFYLRPSYLLRRLFQVKNSFELYALAREGLAVLFKNL